VNRRPGPFGRKGYALLVTGLGTFRGAVLLQRGDEDLLAAADGTTGTVPDADCTLSAPGQRFSYSSPGYVLLAWIVERAADQSYASFLTREIFEPLAMAASFAGNGGGEPGLAAGHRAGTRVASSFELDTVGMGAGDVWSTVGDLARWDRAVASGRILAGPSRRAMLTVQAPIDPRDGLIRTEGYGYGCFIGRDSGGRRLIYHTGDNAGFVAVNVWFPEDDVRLVVVSNEETTDLMAIIREGMATAFPPSG
jgi:CubicO group peptidase (beta-lactamase class C family)